MNMKSTNRIIITLCLGALTVGCQTKSNQTAPRTTAGTAYSGEHSVGHTLYMQNCSACHGEKGQGDGPVAKAYNVPPPNLTRIAERNQGEFPFEDIFAIIEGRREIDAHGTRQMPVWGVEFRRSAWEVGLSEEAQIIADGNLLALASWLERIQIQSK